MFTPHQGYGSRVMDRLCDWIDVGREVVLLALYKGAFFYQGNKSSNLHMVWGGVIYILSVAWCFSEFKNGHDLYLKVALWLSHSMTGTDLVLSST